MSPLEEMAQTYVSAFFGEKDDGSWTISEDVMRGLRAVLEKHVGPMLDMAHLAGRASYQWNPDRIDTRDYTARIIAQLTK